MLKFNLSECEFELKDETLVYLSKDVKEFIKLLKENWKAKMRRMELISVDVAIYELNCEINKLAGKDLIDKHGSDDVCECVKKVLSESYKKCMDMLSLEKHKDNAFQRMDEIALNYSSIFDCSVNEAKEELEQFSKKSKSVINNSQENGTRCPSTKDKGEVQSSEMEKPFNSVSSPDTLKSTNEKCKGEFDKDYE